MNLPFMLPGLSMKVLTEKFSIVFTNVNCSKIPYVWDGKHFNCLFVFAPGSQRIYTTVSLLTVGSGMTISINTDESCMPDPQAVCDTFAKKNKEVLGKHSAKSD
mmetsp:Transcript_16071/g.27130  ORF Transcript_16071/g.27130 Transcript_16071/m.27130 type:complete len:104 (+) Transcript_16071:1299-1610(+)